MTALIPIQSKLAKLIPRLASNADGEVVATVRAIGRALDGAGADWHDLAKALEGNRVPHNQAAPQTGQTYRPQAQQMTEREALYKRALWLEGMIAKVPQKHHDFIRDMRCGLERGRSITPKQKKYLQGLFDRYA